MNTTAPLALAKYSDIHSHDRQAASRGDTIVNINPGEEMIPGGTYSVGIHPWDTAQPITLSQLKQLVITACDSRIVAIGECGYDTLRGGDMTLQRRLFIFHARLAEKLAKPLIIHNVRSTDRLIADRRLLKPTVEWIIHGFRGKQQLADQLHRHGFLLSAKDYSADYHETDFNII